MQTFCFQGASQLLTSPWMGLSRRMGICGKRGPFGTLQPISHPWGLLLLQHLLSCTRAAGGVRSLWQRGCFAHSAWLQVTGWEVWSF